MHAAVSLPKMYAQYLTSGNVPVSTFERCSSQSRLAQSRAFPSVYEAIAIRPLSITTHTRAHLPWSQSWAFQGQFCHTPLVIALDNIQLCMRSIIDLQCVDRQSMELVEFQFYNQGQRCVESESLTFSCFKALVFFFASGFYCNNSCYLWSAT